MDLEIITTPRSLHEPAPTPAFCEGAPLVFDPAVPLTLTACFQRTAKECPAKGIWFVQRDGSERFVTYPALLERALRAASGLNSAGLCPGSNALLQLDSLEDHNAAFWGCLLAGVIPVTVAIPPSYTERNGVVDKLFNTWQLLGQPAIVTTATLQPRVESLSTLLPMRGLRVLPLESLTDAPIATPHLARPDEVAFIQLSSGSTGVPKCIQETHQSILAHIHSSQQNNGYKRDDITVNWLPMDHVVPLLTFHLKDTVLGINQIHAPADLVLAEPLLWLDLLERHQATHTWAPNFAFKLVADRLARAPGRSWDLSRVKYFMNAGEQVTVPVTREFLHATAAFGVREAAMQPAFGMAEVCTCMTYANGFSLATGSRRFLKSSLDGPLRSSNRPEDAATEFVSLGGVSPGVAIRIANADNHTLPEGTIGRLQIRGPVVTPGYLRNDEANLDAFVGNGWFNTGDLGFMLDGELYLSGREKEMIIIRGAKFYCYEVEDVVNSVLGVEPTFAAACGVNDPATGTEALSLFFVSSGITDALQVARAIRKQVTARLGIAPRFVVPLERNQFPKTTSGKIQRTRLKHQLEKGVFDPQIRAMDEEEQEIESRDVTLMGSSTEGRLRKIWEEVLGRQPGSLETHLFDLGGDSLKATQIVSRVRDRWHLEFPLHLLFGRFGTVAGMARWIEDHQHGEADRTPPAILPLAQPAPYRPLSYAQMRLWLAEQIDPGTPLYNICRVLSLVGPLQFPALEKSLQLIVDRHEILRTVYRLEDIPIQEVQPEWKLTVPRHDLAHAPANELRRTIANFIDNEAARPFDLETGPLLRAKVLRIGEDQHVLVVVFHQIVTDAWSLNRFLLELRQLYEAFAENRPNPLPPLQIQYGDYAHWQQRWFSHAALDQQLAYWRRKLNGVLPATFSHRAENTPPISGGDDADPSAVRTEDNASSVIKLRIPKATLEAIRACGRALDASLHMVLLAVFDVLIAHSECINEVVTGTPESGRHRPETESLLGCFVNILLLRTEIGPQDTFASVVARVRENVLEASTNSEVPFEMVLQALPAAEYRERPFRFWFGPIDSMREFRMGGIHAEVSPVFPPQAQFDLSCFVSEQPDSVTCYFEHRKQAISTSRLTRLVQRFERLLLQLTGNPDVPFEQYLPKFDRLDSMA